MLVSRFYRSDFTLIKSRFFLVARQFTTQNVACAAKMPPRLLLKEEDIEEAFLKGSGPGGQKIVWRHFYGSLVHQFGRLTFLHRVRTRLRPPSS